MKDFKESLPMLLLFLALFLWLVIPAGNVLFNAAFPHSCERCGTRFGLSHYDSSWGEDMGYYCDDCADRCGEECSLCGSPCRFEYFCAGDYVLCSSCASDALNDWAGGLE